MTIIYKLKYHHYSSTPSPHQLKRRSPKLYLIPNTVNSILGGFRFFDPNSFPTKIHTSNHLYLELYPFPVVVASEGL